MVVLVVLGTGAALALVVKQHVSVMSCINCISTFYIELVGSILLTFCDILYVSPKK